MVLPRPNGAFHHRGKQPSDCVFPMSHSLSRLDDEPREHTRSPWRQPRRADRPSYLKCHHCGLEFSLDAPGTRHRNHCPYCLWSVHLDKTPGDRASLCRGGMEPIAIWVDPQGEGMSSTAAAPATPSTSTASPATTTSAPCSRWPCARSRASRSPCDARGPAPRPAPAHPFRRNRSVNTTIANARTSVTALERMIGQEPRISP